MNLITTLAAFVLALAILIVVHELGHYLVARRCGVKVLRFSVGFGRPLWQRTVGPDRTQWVIAAVPFGGYVKMLDENDPDCRDVPAADLARAFNRQHVAKRAAIVVAGPLANFLLAIALYWGASMVGTQEAVPYLGPPVAGSVAERAGARDGDLVLDIEGEPVRSWGQLNLALVKRGLEGGPAELRVRSVEGGERLLRLDLARAGNGEIDEAWFGALGLVHGGGRPVVREAVPEGRAYAGGVRDGDLVVAVDGEPMRTTAQLTQTVRRGQGRSAQHWRVERDGRKLELTVEPEAVTLPDGTRIGRVGVDLQAMALVRYGPWEGLRRAAQSTWDTSVMSLRMLVHIVEGRASLHNLSGAITVADYAGQAARIGLVAYVNFLAFVSISLGVLNLLPVPVLDGGHLLYYAVEVVKGSPLSLRALEVSQRIGIGMLVLLTAIALYNDLTRLLS